MISLTLIILAAICNAIMDTIRDHYYISILPRTKWWGSEDWKAKYVDRDPNKGIIWYWQLLSWFDAWHFFKWWMVTFYILAIVFYTPIFGCALDALFLGVVSPSIFLLFYKKILLKGEVAD